MGDNRPNVYVENGVSVYRASSLGHCERALLAARKGMEPLPFPDFMYDRFEEGNVAEPHIMARFCDDNPDWKLDGSQDEIVINVAENIIVRGHIDGMAVRNNQRCVVEAKALGTDWFNKFKKKGLAGLPDSYAWQLSIYMAALKTDHAVLVAGQKIGGLIVPESEFHYLWIDTPPFTLEQICERVTGIESKVDDKEWPPCLNEWLCGYPYLHDEPEFVEWDQVDDWGDRWDEAAQLEKRAKEIKTAIKSEMEQHEQTSNKFVATRWKVTMVEETVPEQTVTRKAYTKKYPRFTKCQQD